MSVTARWRFSMAARRLVPVVTRRAVRLVELLEGICALYFALCAFCAQKHKSSNSHCFLGHRELFLPLALPLLTQALRVEGSSRAVAQVHDLVPHACCDKPVRFGASHAARHLLQLLKRQETPDACTNLATLDERRSFGHRFIRAVQKHRQDSDACVKCEIADDGFEVGQDARHRSRAFGEDERVITLVQKRSRVTKRLP